MNTFQYFNIDPVSAMSFSRASDRSGHDTYDSMIVSMVFKSLTQQLPVISAQKARQQITAAVSVFFQPSCSWYRANKATSIYCQYSWVIAAWF